MGSPAIREPYVVLCRECDRQVDNCECEFRGSFYWTEGEKEPPTVISPVMHLTDLRVPIHVARGHYEKLTQEQLDEHMFDVFAEQERRDGSRARIARVLGLA